MKIKERLALEAMARCGGEDKFFGIADMISDTLDQGVKA